MIQDNDRQAAEKFLIAKNWKYLTDSGWEENKDGWKRIERNSRSRRIMFEDAVKMQQLIDKWGARVAAAR